MLAVYISISILQARKQRGLNRKALGSEEGCLVWALRIAKNLTGRRNEGIPAGETCVIRGRGRGHTGEVLREKTLLEQ